MQIFIVVFCVGILKYYAFTKPAIENAYQEGYKQGIDNLCAALPDQSELVEKSNQNAIDYKELDAYRRLYGPLS